MSHHPVSRRFVVSSAATVLLSIALCTGVSVYAQSPTDGVTDLQLHPFHPTVSPALAAQGASSSDLSVDSNGMSHFAAAQIVALQREKSSRTAAQRKIDSNVLYTERMLRGMDAAPGVPSLDTGVTLDVNNNIVVDMVVNVSDALLGKLSAAGATVLYLNAPMHSIRALIPSNQMEGIAALPDVIFINPMQKASHSGRNIRPVQGTGSKWNLAPGFEVRAARVRAMILDWQKTHGENTVGTPVTGQGSVETEGDIAHGAVDARGIFGINGAGLKIGVLSDGVAHAALSQATGDLPPTCGTPPCLTVLSGQAGTGDEGTAMLEIIHDMVPGASLYFATADNSLPSFAANIEALQAAGCNIIVDDVFYFVETPFQDGQASTVISTSQGGAATQAVNTVVAAGAYYFSSAGNEGNLDAATSGTFEGDFVPMAASSPLPAGNVHNFGSGNGYDTITAPGDQIAGLFWTDPLGASGNDYDLYVLDSTSTSIIAASTNIQNGTQDPEELISSAAIANGDRIVVFQNTGAANRFFHLVLFRGYLAVATSGETHGHSAASGAYTVAATPAAAAFGSPTPNGPYPGLFTSSSQTEYFSSDGLRHIFFHADSSAITPGNFSSTGGEILNKPDITAADGVSVTGVGGFGSPFYGTSAAAPAAASVAALVLSAKPTITAAQMKTALTTTAIDIMNTGFDRDSGYGIVMPVPAIESLGIAGLANPELGSIVATENPGNGNGTIERGEGALLTIPLKNTTGVMAATGIRTTLTSSTPGVTILQPGTSAYADLAAGAGPENNLTPFAFTLASNFPCGVMADFALSVSYSSGQTRVLNFSVQTGMLTITNTLGTTPAVPAGITFATGTQTGRISRNGVASACGTSKTFPGSVAGSHSFDSYSFQACSAQCFSPTLNAGAAGINLFESLYSPSYNSSSIGTDYAGDPGLSGSIQEFGVSLTGNTGYSIVINDVGGNPATPPNTYTLQIPSCAVDCNVNQVPVAIAQNVTVTAATYNGTANANINNGSYDPDGGSITLTQNPAGPYPIGTTSVILTVTDSLGAFAQATANVTVNQPAVTATQVIASTMLTVNHAATTFTPVTGSGGTAPLSYSVSPGLPAGLSFSSATGAIAGTPSAASATTTHTVTVTDKNGATATASFSLTVNSAVTATQVIASTMLTVNHAATTFTPVTGSGGTAPLSYSVSPGLPAGLSFSSTTGAITGIPSAASATTTYTVTVTDADSATATASFSLTVSTTVTATQAVPSTTLTANHAATTFTPVTGSGGTAPLSYSVSPGLPVGLSFSSTTGAITGIPSAASATTTYTVTVTDANGVTATASFSLTVDSAVVATQAIASEILTENFVVQPPFIPVTGSGGDGPLKYSISPGLPTGLTLSSTTGTISGTPSVASIATTYTVTVTDTNGATATASFGLTVNGAVAAKQAIASEVLTQNYTPTPFTPVIGSGGTIPLKYSISPGLPTGLNVSATTGVISGTPLVTSAATTYTVMVTDANGATASNTFSLAVDSGVVATKAISSEVLTQNHAATPFTPVTGSGGATPLAYSVSPGLPAGLTFSITTGAISGTPTAVSAATTYTVTVTDANGATATASFSLTVDSGVVATQVIASEVLTQNHATSAFTPVTGSGGTAPLSYSVSPALPAGLSFSVTTAAISGTPSVASAATTYTVTVTDANRATATASFSLTVDSRVVATQVIASEVLTQNRAVTSLTLVTGSGGVAPLTYSVSPGLPAGLSFSASTGTISGTPSVASAATTYTVTATDTNGATATASFSLTVDSAVTAMTTVSATTLTVFQPVVAFTPVTGAGGDAPLAYSVVPGLPAGLGMASATGAITGTPSVISSATTYTVTVTDINSATATATFSLGVARQATMTTVSANLTAATPAQTVTLTATVSATFAGTPVTPSGTVTFYDNGTALKSELITAGAAQLTTSLPAGATQVITAVYSGDGNFLTSTSSNSAAVAVAPLDFTFSGTGTMAYTAAPGAVASYSFALAPLYGSYAGGVSFSVTGLPAGATASFTPSTVAAGSGAATVVMTVQTASAIAHNHDRGSPFGREIVLALLFLPFLSKRRVREKMKGRMLLMVLLMAGLTAALTGCASTNGFQQQSQQSYTLTVTAITGTLQHSQTVTLIVQ